jgi:hypothetical protein
MMVLVVSGVCALYYRERKQSSEKISELSGRQGRTERILKEFIEESEKVARELSRRLSPAPDSLPATTTTDAPVASPRKKRGAEKKHQVLNLAGKGRPAKEIAERLMLPAGEVELILNLDNSRKGQVSATS